MTPKLLKTFWGKVLTILLALYLTQNCSFAQGEIDEESKLFYRNERTVGVSLNSNGLSGDFRYAKRLDGYRKSLYVVELSYLKDPKENKIQTTTTGNRFVYGKVNNAYSIRLGIGMQKEVFQKQDVGSISIRYFYHGGFVTTMLKPIYYELDSGSINGGGDLLIKFNPHYPPGNIVGKAPFSKGLDETKFIPGIYTKAGFTFEFSSTDVVFNALEVGMSADLFAKKIVIMDKPHNDIFLISVFLTYRFGTIVDAQFKRNKNKLDEIVY